MATRDFLLQTGTAARVGAWLRNALLAVAGVGLLLGLLLWRMYQVRGDKIGRAHV